MDSHFQTGAGTSVAGRGTDCKNRSHRGDPAGIGPGSMSWALNRTLDWKINQLVGDQIFGLSRAAVVGRVTSQVRDPVGRAVNQQLFHPVRAQLEQDIRALRESGPGSDQATG